MAFAGLGWLLFMSPPIARDLSLCIEVLGVVAEASLMLWLLVMGVNVRQWKEQTIAAEKLPSFVSAVRVRSRREPI
jgi:tellurite resistance protein TehA-like permease